MSKTETFVFPRPISPTKDDLRPNPHPYSIKTTSTGVLSRSNSNSSPRPPAGTHHYVPPSPSRSPSRANSASGNRMSGHGHRYSRSLSSDGPRPLPIPPQSPSSVTSAQFPESRSPSLPTLPGVTQQRLPALDELPSNPKAWTPSQLSLYLSTTLRVRSGETMQLPTPVAQDIANFVKESKITGRSFLRMKEDDLEQFEINKLWRSALLSASRSLRQSVLKGRIWGFGSVVEEPCSPVSVTASDDDDMTPHKRRRSISLDASSSTESLTDNSQSRITGRFRNGRVKGMVENFERSNSVDEGMPDWSSASRRERSSSNASSNNSIYETADPDANEYATATARPSLSRPLPVPPSESSANSGDELSMDELLQQAGILPRRSSPQSEEPLADTHVNKRRTKRRGVGVHAWEQGSDRVTVKRVMPIPGTGIEDLFAMAPILASPASESVPLVDEARLEAELEETKRMIAQLRKRVELVEMKVDDMEAREQQREREEEEAAVREQPVSSPQGSILGKVFTALLGDRAVATVQRTTSKLLSSSFFDRLAEPTTITGLPSYFILVGLGVCAVVLKVLIRKSAAVALISQRRR